MKSNLESTNNLNNDLVDVGGASLVKESFVVRAQVDCSTFYIRALIIIFFTENDNLIHII